MHIICPIYLTAFINTMSVVLNSVSNEFKKWKDATPIMDPTRKINSSLDHFLAIISLV